VPMKDSKSAELISLGNYDEFSPGYGFDSLKEHCSSTKYENQDRIVAYLSQGFESGLVSMSYPHDVFTGERIPCERMLINDGVYQWWKPLAYYVKIYNLRLPPEVEEHMLANYNSHLKAQLIVRREKDYQKNQERK